MSTAVQLYQLNSKEVDLSIIGHVVDKVRNLEMNFKNVGLHMYVGQEILQPTYWLSYLYLWRIELHSGTTFHLAL